MAAENIATSYADAPGSGGLVPMGATGGADPYSEFRWAVSPVGMNETDAGYRARAATMAKAMFGVDDPFGRVFSEGKHGELAPMEYYGKMMGYWQSRDHETLMTDEMREYSHLETDKERTEYAVAHWRKRLGDHFDETYESVMHDPKPLTLAEAEQLGDIISEDDRNVLATYWNDVEERAMQPTPPAPTSAQDVPPVVADVLLSGRPVESLTPEEREAYYAAQSAGAPTRTLGTLTPEERDAFNAEMAQQTDLYRTATAIGEKYRQAFLDIGIRKKYEGRLAEENQWMAYMRLRDGFTPEERHVVDLALAEGARDGIGNDTRRAFMALPTDSQWKVAPLLQKNAWRQDNSIAHDAVVGAVNVLGDLVGDTFTGAAGYVKRLFVSAEEYQDEIERRALLRQAMAPRLKERGIGGEMLIGAASTVPYMYVAGLKYIGTASMMLSAGEQFDREAALAGADVSGLDMILTKAAFSLGYAFAEGLQNHNVFGELTDFERRMLYCNAANAFRSKLALKFAGEIASTTIHEAIEEGIQNGIQEAYVALGVGEDVGKAFMGGFVEDAVGTLGTMFLTSGFGAARNAVKYNRRAFASTEDAIQWGIELDKVRRLTEVGPLTEDERSRLGDGMAALGNALGPMLRDWRRAAATLDEGARRKALTDYGLSPEQAAVFDAYISEIERNIGDDKVALQSFYGTGRALTHGEIREAGGMKEERRDDGTRVITVANAFGGGDIAVEFRDLSVDPQSAEDAPSIVSALGGMEKGWTLERWNALSPEEKAEFAKGLVKYGEVRITTPEGAVDGRLKAFVEGRMALSDGTDGGDVLTVSALHEQMHVVAAILRRAADAGNEDAAKTIKAIRAKYGDAVSGNERFDEERFADAFRDWIVGTTVYSEDGSRFRLTKAQVGVADDDSGLFERVADFIRGLFASADEEASRRVLYDEFMERVVNGEDVNKVVEEDDAAHADATAEGGDLRETPENAPSQQENAPETPDSVRETPENADSAQGDAAEEKARRQLADYEERLSQLPETATKKRRDLEKKIAKARRALERAADGESRASIGSRSGVTPEENAAYMDAVRRGDTETAGRMVREAAKKVFGWTEVAYHGGTVEGEIDRAMLRSDIHGIYANSREKGARGYGNIHALFVPKTFFDFDSFELSEQFSWEDVFSAAGRMGLGGVASEIDAKFNSDEAKFDAFAEELAKEVEEQGDFNGDTFGLSIDGIAMRSVPQAAFAMGTGLIDADKLLEQYHAIGYWDSEIGGETYVIDPAYAKSADPVTYDDAGNVIPLSQRFDPQKSDIRFSIGHLYTGSAADYAERVPELDKDGKQTGWRIDNGPSLQHIGTGEGSQVYGWGLYASDQRGVAGEYATLDSGAYLKNEKPISDYFERTVAEALDDYGWDVAKTISGLQEKNKTLGTATQKENNAIIRELRAHGEEYRRKSGSIYEQTFFTDRADGEETERHLLKWYEPVSEEQRQWILDSLDSLNPGDIDGLKTLEVTDAEAEEDLQDLERLIRGIVQNAGDNTSGGDLYRSIAHVKTPSGYQMGEKAASLFLARAGIDGIKYPVDSYGKTVKDGDEAGWNYVSFRDDNIRVDHKWVDGEKRYSIGSRTGGKAYLSTMDAAVAFAARDEMLGRQRPDEYYNKLIASLGLQDMYTPDELRKAGKAVAATARIGGTGKVRTKVWRAGMRDNSLRELAGYAKAGRLVDEAIGAAYHLGERAGAANAEKAAKAERQLQKDADALQAEMKLQEERMDAEVKRLEAERESDARVAAVKAEYEGRIAELKERHKAMLGEIRAKERARRKGEEALRKATSRMMRAAAKGYDLRELDAMSDVPMASLMMRISEVPFSGAAEPGAIREKPKSGGEDGDADSAGETYAPVGEDESRLYPSETDIIAAQVDAKILAEKLDAVVDIFRKLKQSEEDDAKERARKRAEREEREAEEAEPIGNADIEESEDEEAADDSADSADSADDAADEAEEPYSDPELVRQYLAALKTVGVGLTSATDFALFVQAFVEYKVQEEDEQGRADAISTHGRFMDPVVQLRYHKTMVNFLKATADALLDPEDDASAKWAERRIGGIPDNATRRQLFIAARDILGYIQRNGLKQSRRRMMRDLDRYLKRVAVQGKKMDPLAPDLMRRVTARVEQDARWTRRVLKMTNGRVRREQEELQAVIEKRRAQGADESDVEIDRALRRMAILGQFGGLRYRMPAEIKTAQNYLEEYYGGEAARLAERAEARKQSLAEVAAALQEAADAVRAAHGGVDADNPGIAARVFDSLAGGSVRQRLTHLTGDNPKARAAIDRIVGMLFRGETRRRLLERQFRDEQTAMLERVAARGGVSVRELLDQLDEAVPDALSRQLATPEQNRNLTWGQALQLLASLDQVASYANNIALHGREDHARLIREAMADKPQFEMLLQEIRALYAGRRELLSDASMETTGLPILSPDPLFMPVRMKRARREGLDTKVKTWTPWNAIFTPRVANTLDFDTSADILEVLAERSRETANSVAFSSSGLDLRSILGRSETQEAFARARGGYYNTKLIEQVTDSLNGWYQEATNAFVSLLKPIGNLTTYATLSWNVVTMLNQMTSIPAWQAVLDGGYAQLWRCMTLAATDGAAWRRAAREFMDAPGFHSRYGTDASGMAAFREMMADALSDPNTPRWQRFHKAGMTLVQFGDFVPSMIVGPGVYLARKEAIMRQNPGMAEDAAKEQALADAWNLVEQCQQSDLMMNLPDILRRQGVVARSVMKFANSPLMQVAHEVNAFRMWRDAKAHGDEDGAARWRSKFAGQLLCNHVLMPAAMMLAQRVVESILGEEPPEDDEMLGTILLEMMVGPLSRVFIAGSILTDFAAWGLKQTGLKPKTYATNDSMGASVQMLKYLAQDGTRMGSDLCAMDFESLRDDFLRMAGRTTRPVKYAVQAVDNALGYDPAKAKAKRKREREKAAAE